MPRTTIKLGFALLLVSCGRDPSPPMVDLVSHPWYVTKGFVLDAANEAKPGQTGPLSFPIAPNKIFQVKPSGALFEYSAATTFYLSSRELESEPLGIRFATIGENWEIYVNGQRIAGEMHVNPAGELTIRRSLRDLVLPLPRSALRAGKNELVVRLVGTGPGSMLTPNTALGFYQSRGYEIDRYENLVRDTLDLPLYAGVALFSLFGSFALLLAAYRRSDKYAFYFGALCIDLSIYYLVRSPLAYRLVFDTAVLNRIEYASVSLAGAFLVMFIHAFLAPIRRLTTGVKGLAGISFGLAVLALFVPFRRTDVVLLAWQAVGGAIAIYIVWSIGWALARNQRDAVKLIPGILLLTVAGLWDIVDSAILSTGQRYGQYAMGVFIISLAYNVTERTVRTQQASRLATDRLAAREAHMRSLFDASFEALVVHDHGKVVDANPAFARWFEAYDGNLHGRQLSEFFSGTTLESVQEVLDGESHEPRRGKIRIAGGVEIAVEFTSRPLVYQGRELAVFTIRDITERSQADDELRAKNAELELLARSLRNRADRVAELEQQVAALRAKPPKT